MHQLRTMAISGAQAFRGNVSPCDTVDSGRRINLMTDNLPYPLSEGFLHCLAKYLGNWSDGESKFRISRRSDGWLEAWRTDSTETAEVPVGVVLRGAKKVSEPESPLGPYPIVVSEELMHTWLTPEEFERLRGGIHVSVGRKTIVESIEH